MSGYPTPFHVELLNASGSYVSPEACRGTILGDMPDEIININSNELLVGNACGLGGVQRLRARQDSYRLRGDQEFTKRNARGNHAREPRNGIYQRVQHGKL